MSLRRQLQRYFRWLVVIGVLVVVATVSGGYILIQERLPNPLKARYELSAEFSATSGLNPGLGQPVNVAGVKVGTVTGSKLRDGLSVVSMEIDPKLLPHVYANARAVMQPNTPLKDLQVELYPGRHPAKVLPPGQSIPVGRTQSPIDADELLSALDGDTRDFFQILVTSGDVATAGRGRDMRALFQALGPTTAQVRQLGDAVAARRVQLARLIHNLAVLTDAAAGKDTELGQVVDAGNATLHSVVSEDVALRDSLTQLPPTLAAARASLHNGTRFANALGPTLDALMPTARRLRGTLAAAQPLVTQAEPILRDQVRPLVREAQPLAVDLAPTTSDLAQVTPDLISAFKVLNYVANELGYNPPGSDEGYLYWLAWFSHNAASVFSTGDAHGAMWRGLALFSCSSLADPRLAPVLGLLLGPVAGCTPPPGGGGGG